MNIGLRELSDQDKRLLNQLFQSKGFDMLVRIIDAECFYEAQQLKIDLVDLAVNPDSKLDREPLMKCARLRLALDVLKEFSQEDKIHYEITIDP